MNEQWNHIEMHGGTRYSAEYSEDLNKVNVLRSSHYHINELIPLLIALFS